MDGINIKLAKCGGLREALRMIAVARAHGLMVMVGCMIESSLGITAAAHFTPLVDIVDLDGAALLAEDPFIGRTDRRGTGHASLRTGSRRQAAMTDRFALVALPLPLATPYTYRIPETLGDRVVPGARVVVPVRRRELIGVVVGWRASPPAQRLKECWPCPTRAGAVTGTAGNRGMDGGVLRSAAGPHAQVRFARRHVGRIAGHRLASEWSRGYRRLGRRGGGLAGAAGRGRVRFRLLREPSIGRSGRWSSGSAGCRP